MAGAEYLHSIFGTEKDKVNCPFYFKIGACRHGDKCERRHNKPTMSPTILLPHLYQNPATLPNYDPKRSQMHFDDFYEDLYEELTKYGDVEELNICDNVCDHLVGNIYVKYFREDGAERALRGLTGRFYGGKPVVAEYSPVTDFREASCRQFEMHECTRGGQCNFMHLKQISRELHSHLFRRRRGPRGASPRDRARKRRSRSPMQHEPPRRRRDRFDGPRHF